jgi:uncharacterized iron-regulated protein
MRNSLILFLSLSLIASNSLTSLAQQSQSGAEPTYVPQRVYHSEEKKFSDFETMLSDLAKADVVFIGEQHDDPNTHRLERALLEGLARRRGASGASVVVALEMFERDVQPVLDEYLAGKITEEEFLKQSRPWPRYATDYRPIIEFARAHSWRIIASNTPRRYASQVAKSGLAELEKLPASERGFIAREINCPMDDYYKRFIEAMGGHPGAPAQKSNDQTETKPQGLDPAMMEKIYHAQCLKDETMGESIADVYLNAADPKPLIVHYNGAFHSDYRLGTAARAQSRLPKAKIRIVTVIPVENLDSLNPEESRKRGDYVVFTLKRRQSQAEK